MNVTNTFSFLTTHTKQARPLSKREILKQIQRLTFKDKKNPEEIAKKLPNLVETFQQNSSFDNLLDIIFKAGDDSSITTFITAMQIAYPEFKLSPFDQIRQKIVEDKNHELNNESLYNLLKVHNLIEDDEKLDICFDLAFRMNHPYIYQVADTPISPSDYTLNFLWVNLNPQDRIKNIAQNIFGEGLNCYENAECLLNPTEIQNFDSETVEEIKKTFLFRLIKCTETHPGVEINLWCDSTLVTLQAWKNTSEMIEKISKSKNVNIKLRDIRTLDNIDTELENVLHPGIPVYYRVDLLKVLIPDYMIWNDNEVKKYCVMSDIDVEPMDAKQIFDKRTKNYLSTHGYVFNRCGHENFENNFSIFNKQCDSLGSQLIMNVLNQASDDIKRLREFSRNHQLIPNDYLSSQKIYNYHYVFFQKNEPRKIVKSPKSQFGAFKNFPVKSHQNEMCRFIGKSDIPYGKNGRYYNPQNEEIQIKELLNWKAEPLNIT
ncbi:MAG: hypothetical protein VX777_08130 [Chlamydiota bacterium]|nr:hypothetical protein [Chlamydiota bacterium]